MRDTSMVLMSDFYKQAHAEQYPKGVTKLISYATARMSRIPKDMFGDKLTVFGIQSYVKDFLIERFNDTFFNVTLEDAMELYREIIGDTFMIDYVDTHKFEKLHNLGYLPIEVACLPEGTRVPIRSAFELPEGQCQVPFMSIVNTHPDFPWVTEFLESVTSSEIWYPMAIANQAYLYRKIVNTWYNKTGCDMNMAKSAISEFGFRGGEGSSAATLASAAFLTSFNKTATIPAIKYVHDYYGDRYKDIGGGMISTEHSVMCSNYAVDGDEETFLKRLFSEIYPAGALSVVMDTYDYWANIDRCGKGELKDIIMNRNGTVYFRGDSGDPIDIICGYAKPQYTDAIFDEIHKMHEQYESYMLDNTLEKEYNYWKSMVGEELVVCDKNNYDEWMVYRINSDLTGTLIKTLTKYEKNGTVGMLWEMFGGTTTDKGYRVLDSHVRAIYGDSITPNRAEHIYRRLEQKGFAACNVALGAGSFSTQCAETRDGKLLPFTRDSYGIAVKATWCKNESTNKEYQLFKNPKTDTGKFKKSQKGLIYVTEEDGEIVAYDGYTENTLPNGNMLQPIFRDGKMIKETTMEEVRNRLHNNKF